MDHIKLSLLALVATVLCACSALPYAQTADDFLAQGLCAEQVSKERSIDFDEGLETYCSEREQWRPFLDQAAALRRSDGYQRALGDR